MQKKKAYKFGYRLVPEKTQGHWVKGGKNALVWKVFGATQRDLLLSLAGLRGSDHVGDDDGGGDFV